MTDFALDTLLAPIEGDDAPVGPDLEYDPEFLELQRAATPKAEKVMGDDVKAAEEPDWSDVINKATALLQRAKDLRVAVPLTTAWLRSDGMPGLAAGLALIHGLLKDGWDTVYPQLDADDDNDPTERVNAVAPIAGRQGLIGYLESTPFVQSARVGRFSLYDLRVANGEITPAAPDGEDAAAPAASMAEIEACCMDCAEEELVATIEAIGQALDTVQAIDAIFNENVGTLGPELKPLLADLGEIKKFLGPQLARRNPEAAAEMSGEDVAEGDGAPAVANNGQIKGPQDVVRRLDDICDYYARVEPSSPIPLLLRRARRLVGLSFEDLMKDLAPGGISELQVVSGSTDE